MTAAHDVGKAVNPQLVEGQIEGGTVQSLGYGLTEDLLIDEKGKIMNPSFFNLYYTYSSRCSENRCPYSRTYLSERSFRSQRFR